MTCEITVRRATLLVEDDAPELALFTTSTARVRIVLMHLSCRWKSEVS